MQNSGSPHLDLTGKLIIKVALGDDIRRIPIHNEEITYDELVLMMQRVYRGKLSTNDEITIKYKDEDGDLITIFDSSDLTFAIQCSRILKITLFVGGASKSVLEPAEASMIRQELQELRDRVIGLLDKMESSSALVTGTQALNLADGIAGQAGDSVRKATPPVVSNSGGSLVAGGGKEFDPLTLASQKSVEESTQNKVMASFGMDGNVSSTSQYDRAATPDSISSIGSSASNQVRAQQQTQHQPPVTSTPQQPPSSQQQAMPQQQQQQQQMQYAGQPGYNAGQPGQMPQAYGGQSPYGSPQPPQAQPQGLPHQQQQQQPQAPPQQQQPQAPQQQQQPQAPQQQQQQYDPAMYGQYGQGYGAPSGPPGQAPTAPGQGHMMYGQASPNPYGQAPGMPAAPQAKAPGYPPAPGQAPGNPYSRGGPGYSSGGYPRPTAGYPQ